MKRILFRLTKVVVPSLIAFKFCKMRILADELAGNVQMQKTTIKWHSQSENESKPEQKQTQNNKKQQQGKSGEASLGGERKKSLNGQINKDTQEGIQDEAFGQNTQRKDEQTIKKEQKSDEVQQPEEQKLETKKQQIQSNISEQVEKKSKPSSQQLKEEESDEKPQQDAKETQNLKKDTKVATELNSVIVSDKCSASFIQYLQNSGLKVISVPENQVDISIKNKRGDVKSFKFSEINENQITTWKLVNFLNPPHIINEINDLQLLLKSLQDDQFLITTYLPAIQQKPFQKNEFDTYHPSKCKKTDQLQHFFVQRKYNSGSNKNCYVILRDKQIAKELRIGENRIGEVYIFSKPKENISKQATTLLSEQRFVGKMLAKEQKQKSFDYFTHHPINEINVDLQMGNFIQKQIIQGDKRKILVVSSKQRKPQFLKNINNILLKVGKMKQKQVVIITTSNPKLLRKYFQIQPEDFVTIRLIDLQSKQEPILSFSNYHKSLRTFYSRQTLTGPFSVQNLCNFISSAPTQYYQQTKMNPIDAIVDDEIKNLSDTILLYEKYGCEGCRYAKDLLNSILKLKENLSQETIHKYHIEQPDFLKDITIKRTDILNEGKSRRNSDGHDVTPRLLYIDGQFQVDLNISQIFRKLNQVEKVEDSQILHEELMKNIIDGYIQAKIQRQSFDEQC